MRVFRLTNKANTGTWVAASTQEEAVAYFVKRGRAKKPENVKASDITELLLVAHEDSNFAELIRTLTTPAFLAIRQVASIQQIRSLLAQGKPLPTVKKTWVVW